MTTEFRKYNSIENSYNQKTIVKHLDYNPDLNNMVFVVREKLDGANIQLLFTPGCASYRRVGKRSSWLDTSDNFFDIWATLARYKKELDLLQRHADHNMVELRVYGEIFGPGINGRINYGPEKKIAFFDVYQNDVLMTHQELDHMFKNIQMSYMLAPLIMYTTSLMLALNVNEVFNSKILNIDNNEAEGVVITPYEKNVYMPNGNRFILKKKSEKFSESMNVDRKDKPAVSGEVMNAIASFKGYINENRVLSAFSKHGPISNQSQIGDYIRIIREDAIEDFTKDNPDLVMDKDTAHMVFNVGGDIVKMLRKYL